MPNRVSKFVAARRASLGGVASFAVSLTADHLMSVIRWLTYPLGSRRTAAAVLFRIPFTDG